MTNYTSFHNVESVKITEKSESKHGGENRRIKIEMADTEHEVTVFFNEGAEVTVE